MDVTQLRYFLKTAELLNYTHAAQALYITRQSLRQAIAAMEAELGQPLFANTRNRLSLTEYGAYLAVSGAEVVRAFDRMQEGLSRLASRQTALRLAFSHSLFPFILPGTESILRAFRTQFPHIRLDVAHMDNDAVIAAAEAGEIDCGLCAQTPCPRTGVTMRALRTYDVAVDYGPGSPLAGRREIAVEDLAGIPLVGMGSLEKTLPSVFQACREKGVTLDCRVTPSTIDAFYYIQNGLAAGFDILRPDAPEFTWNRTGRLTGHRWEIGMLCTDRCSDPSALSLLCAFLEREYGARWAQQEAEWKA